MSKRFLCLFLCLSLFVCLLSAVAYAEVDYDSVVIEAGDTVKKLVEANGLDFNTEKYVVMVLNRLDKEKQLNVLRIGDTIKIPKAPADIDGPSPHLISVKDTVGYYVIPYTVQSGDTLKHIYELWDLKVENYLDLIKQLNPGKDVDLLYVGDRFYLPTMERNLKTDTYTTIMAHVMLQDEQIESVFSRYGIDLASRRDELQSYNTKPLDKIKAGDTLMIPLVW